MSPPSEPLARRLSRLGSSGHVKTATGGRYCDAATVRELAGQLEQAAACSTAPASRDAVLAIREALNHGADDDALGVALRLALSIPGDLAALDAELYAAAISLCAALWHVETGTDASSALASAEEHLHAALDHHTPPSSVST